MATSSNLRSNPVVRFFTSLQLTISCLAIGMVLIFFGTLAQVQLGINGALENIFHTFIARIPIPGSEWVIPLPGGYLVGGVLLVNLIASHVYRFKASWKKSGIILTHVGIILLLIGELFTSLVSVENNMQIDEGETQVFMEADRSTELAIINRSDPATDKVIAIDESLLKAGANVQHPKLPFQIQVVDFFANSRVFENRDGQPSPDSPQATVGLGTTLIAKEIPRTGKMDERDLSIAWVSPVGPDGPLGTWMTCNGFQQEQSFTYEGTPYTIELRSRRSYLPFSLTLKDFSHDKYPGTEIPRNYSSLVRLVDDRNNQNRDVLIYMNHPLRYDGLTFYQSSFIGATTTILRVVQNPSWTLPYISCSLVSIGLLVQFGIHLFGFFRRRAAAI